MTADEALESYYEMCRQLIKGGWTLNDVEEAEFETLVDVVCSKKQRSEPEKIDLMDYMKNERGTGR